MSGPAQITRDYETRLRDLFAQDRVLGEGLQAAQAQLVEAVEQNGAAREHVILEIRRAFHQHRDLSDDRRLLAMRIGETSTALTWALTTTGIPEPEAHRLASCAVIDAARVPSPA